MWSWHLRYAKWRMIEALHPWEPSIIVPLVLGSAAWLYLRGTVSASWLQQIAFWIGLFAFYVVSFTGFDYLAEHEFYMHRVQHAALHHVAPFLITLARPGPRLWASLPTSARKFLQQLSASKIGSSVVRIFDDPRVAVVLFCGLIVLWLTPSIHFVAMLDVRIYKLMNWSIAINGLMFWSLVLNGPLQPAKRIAMMLAVVPPQIVIGFLLVCSSQDFYPIYTLCGRLSGVGPLVDQQLGGAILWLSGAMMSVVGILVLMSSRRQRG